MLSFGCSVTIHATFGDSRGKCLLSDLPICQLSGGYAGPWPSCLQELTYTVTNSQNKKEKISLLQGVSGYLLPREMTALMG